MKPKRNPKNPWETSYNTLAARYLQTCGVEDRLRVVRATLDAPELRRIIAWPGTEKTVRKAAESRLRRLERQAA
jgi:hypothetical protein